MPVSGVVAILHGEPRARRYAIDQLESHPEIEIGESEDAQRIPLVLEGATGKDCSALLRWVQGLDGVLEARVVYVGFEDGGEVGSGGTGKTGEVGG